MRSYKKPEVEMLKLDVLDVIQASGLINGGNGDETELPERQFPDPVSETNYLG